MDEVRGKTQLIADLLAKEPEGRRVLVVGASRGAQPGVQAVLAQSGVKVVTGTELRGLGPFVQEQGEGNRAQRREEQRIARRLAKKEAKNRA